MTGGPVQPRRSWKTGEQQTAAGVIGLLSLGHVEPAFAWHVTTVAVAVVLGRAAVKVAAALAGTRASQDAEGSES